MRSVEDILARLAPRNSLHDFTYFVGRSDKMRELGSGRSGNNAWLHGVRRIGKSSLARRCAQEAEALGTSVIWTDLSDVSKDHFNTLLRRVVRLTDTPSVGSPKEAIENLARRATDRSPILVICDEMDVVAPNLGGDEQAFLRLIASENPHFNYLFISRCDPQRVLELVPDARSRLLGICNIVSLGALRQKDVAELCQRVSDDLGCPEISRVQARIWDVVGGFTVGAAILVHALVSKVDQKVLSADDVEDVFAVKRNDLSDELRLLWHDLSPATREALLSGELVPNLEAAVIRDGYVGQGRAIVRPSWLVDVGRASGVTPSVPGRGQDPSAFATAERLHSLLFAINADLLRRRYAPGFVATSEVLRWGCLARAVNGEGEVAWCVNHLSKTVYEASRKQAEGRDQWRLPESVVRVFKRTRGYLQLVAMRNFWDHDPEKGADADSTNWKFQNEGDVFYRHAGTRSPAAASEWAKIRDGILLDLVQALEEVAGAVRMLDVNQNLA